METKFKVGDHAWVRVEVKQIEINENGIFYRVEPENTYFDLLRGTLNVREDDMAEESEDERDG